MLSSKMPFYKDVANVVLFCLMANNEW